MGFVTDKMEMFWRKNGIKYCSEAEDCVYVMVRNEWVGYLFFDMGAVSWPRDQDRISRSEASWLIWEHVIYRIGNMF